MVLRCHLVHPVMWCAAGAHTLSLNMLCAAATLLAFDARCVHACYAGPLPRFALSRFSAHVLTHDSLCIYWAS